MADQGPRSRLITPPFVAVALATLAYFVAEGVLIPAVPLYVERGLGGNSVAVGWVVGIFAASALLLRPWAGRLSDRRGRRLVMVTGAGLVLVAVAGYLVSRSVAALLLVRLVNGAGEAFFFVGAAAAVSDLAPPDRRGEAMSFFSLSLYLGIGVGPLIGEALVDGSDFTAAWIAAGAITLVTAVLSLVVPETRSKEVRDAGPGRLIHPGGLLPGTVLLASILGMAGFFAFVPLYAPRIGLAGSRMVFVLFSAIVVAFRLFGARIPDRLGVGRTSRVALALSALGLATVAAWGTPAGLVAGTSVFALGIAFATPALMAMAVNGVPATERGSVMGTFTAFIDLGFGLGPVLLGLVVHAAGFRASFATGAAIAAVGFGLLYTRRVVSRTARAA